MKLKYLTANASNDNEKDRFQRCVTRVSVSRPLESVILECTKAGARREHYTDIAVERERQ